MADVAVLILGVVAEIHDIAKDIKENDRQACRLLERVKAIEPAMLAVKQGTNTSSSKPLRQLLATVKMIRKFLTEYARTTNFNRALKRKGNASKFAQAGDSLTQNVQALSLGVTVDTWAKEDAADRLHDLESMVGIMERMERNRTDNHAEVLHLLEALRNDERSELRNDERSEQPAWDEIDYDKDLDFEGSTRLGSGGFGEVRTAKWNGSDVAVKSLPADSLHRDDVRALRKEVRIHAKLHFDHVVHLYAASTIAPHLCLVVELASEGSLLQYLRSTSEPLAHELQTAFLFDIARGMRFLHKKGILHRDLKAANVLVFANGRLKLCDFGLSKIMAESSSRSRQGAVGAEQWMSPEEMNESPATERTDVYSFGIVCFEVTTRMQPFKGMNPTQVVKAVVLEEQRPQIPEGASASPDVVPLMEKCWKQHPVDRPEGFGPVVQTLARVVSRDGDPRTHNAVAVDVTSSPGAQRSVGSPGVGVRTTPETVRDEADASRRAADEESGATVLLPDAGNVQAPIADLPIVTHEDEERLYTAFPVLFLKAIWKYARGGTALFSHFFWKCPDYREVAKDLHNRAERLRSEGKYSEADHVYLEASEIQQETLGPDHPDLAETLNCRALALASQGKYAEADLLYVRAIDIGEETLGADHHDLARWLGNRAFLLAKQNKCAESDLLYLRAVDIGERTLGPDHHDLALWLGNRASLLEKQGKYAEADSLYLRAINIGERTLDPDHPDLADWLGNRAWLLAKQGNFAEADPLYLRAIDIGERTLGPDHHDPALRPNNRAWLLEEQGKDAESNDLCGGCIRIGARKLGTDRSDLAVRLGNRTWLLANQGEYAESNVLDGGSIGMEGTKLGTDHSYLALRLGNRAWLLAKQGKYAEADPLYLRAIDIGERTSGPDDDLAAWLGIRALLLQAQGRHRGAIPLLERVLSIRTRRLGESHERTVGARDKLRRVRSWVALKSRLLRNNPEFA
ncbi:unnamed protein product [Ectocarpus fasciculatus]